MGKWDAPVTPSPPRFATAAKRASSRVGKPKRSSSMAGKGKEAQVRMVASRAPSKNSDSPPTAADEVDSLEQASPGEIAAIQEIFDKTWKNKQTRDRVDGSKVPTRFLVVQAQRNTSVRGLTSYEKLRTDIKARRCQDSATTFQANTHIDENLLSDRLDKEYFCVKMTRSANEQETRQKPDGASPMRASLALSAENVNSIPNNNIVFSISSNKSTRSS